MAFVRKERKRRRQARHQIKKKPQMDFNKLFKRQTFPKPRATETKSSVTSVLQNADNIKLSSGSLEVKV